MRIQRSTAFIRRAIVPGIVSRARAGSRDEHKEREERPGVRGTEGALAASDRSIGGWWWVCRLLPWLGDARARHNTLATTPAGGWSARVQARAGADDLAILHADDRGIGAAVIRAVVQPEAGAVGIAIAGRRRAFVVAAFARSLGQRDHIGGRRHRD